MTEKELRRLGRRELVEIIIEQKKLELKLKEQLAFAERELEDRTIRISKAGSIAAAALSINEVFESAQAAADAYLDSLRTANEDIELRIDQADEECTHMLAEADRQCGEKFAEAERKCAEKLAEAKRQCDEKLAEADRKCAEKLAAADAEIEKRTAIFNKSVRDFIAKHPEMRR